MGTWNAFYVKDPDRTEKAIAAIRKDFLEQEIDEFEDYLGVRMDDEAFEAPEKTLAKLSSQLNTGVMWMSLQSAVDAFQFHHWKSGKHIRSLVYGCLREGEWERVEGQPEPWEREVFFNSKDLEFELQLTTDKAQQQELKRIWQTAEIGNGLPRVRSKRYAHEVARYYRFPHYGVE